MQYLLPFVLFLKLKITMSRCWFSGPNGLYEFSANNCHVSHDIVGFSSMIMRLFPTLDFQMEWPALDS